MEEVTINPFALILLCFLTGVLFVIVSIPVKDDEDEDVGP